MHTETTPPTGRNTLLTMEGLNLIETAIKQKRNPQLAAAFYFATYLGCKPGEMKTVKEIMPYVFRIGGENTPSSRHIKVTPKHIRSRLNLSIKALSSVKIRHIQDNFSTLMKTSFENSKPPTLSAIRILFIRRIQAKQIPLNEKVLLTGLGEATLIKYPAINEIGSEIMVSVASQIETAPKKSPVQKPKIKNTQNIKKTFADLCHKFFRCI